jgi:transcription antitermination factor NusG
MQKNWYIVYTKPKCERKVALTFTKRKIENFLPVNTKQIKSIRKNRVLHEPLFDCYVFAYLAEEDVKKIKMIDGVVNIVYWKGKPAIIQEDEIEAIKEFVTDHQNIKLEKSRIDLHDIARVIDGPKYLIEGNILTVKNTTVKVNLPSIGFTMIAEIASENGIGRKVSFGSKNLLFQSRS